MSVLLPVKNKLLLLLTSNPKPRPMILYALQQVSKRSDRHDLETVSVCLNKYLHTACTGYYRTRQFYIRILNRGVKLKKKTGLRFLT